MKHLILFALFAPTSALAMGESYFESTLSFTGGGFDYTTTPFRLASGAGDLGVGGVTAPFEREPFDGVLAMGNRIDARGVIRGVRVGIGYGVPVTAFRMSDTRGTARIDGAPVDVVARGLEARELRLALGVEAFLGEDVPHAVYADLVGRHVWTTADLAFDGDSSRFAGHGYGYAIAAGTKIGISEHVFVDLGGEVGLVGPTSWSAHVGVGVALGWLDS